MAVKIAGSPSSDVEIKLVEIYGEVFVQTKSGLNLIKFSQGPDNRIRAYRIGGMPYVGSPQVAVDGLGKMVVEG